MPLGWIRKQAKNIKKGAQDLGKKAKQGLEDLGKGFNSGVQAGTDFLDGSGDLFAGLDDLVRGDTGGASQKFTSGASKIGGAVTPDAAEDLIDDIGDAGADFDANYIQPLVGGGDKFTPVDKGAGADEELNQVPIEAETPTQVTAQLGANVDADKRRRGKAGYGGTILTAGSGLASNTARTILGI